MAEQVVEAPGSLAGEPQVQARVLPRQLVHRSQRRLGLAEGRRAVRELAAAEQDLLGLGLGELGRRRRDARPEREPPGASSRVSSRFHSISAAPSPWAWTSTQRASGSASAGSGNARPRCASAAAIPSRGCGSRARRLMSPPDARTPLRPDHSAARRPARRPRAVFRQAEEAGFDDLWTGETNGPDGFTPLALAAAVTERIRLGTGIVNPFTRGPAVLAQHAAALQDASNGRFVLGLGSSSNVIVERWNEVPFVKPLTKVREAVGPLRPAWPASAGRRLQARDAAAQPVPIVIAALRGKMLALAAEIGDGAFTNFLPISGAPQVVEGFGAPDKELVCRFFCVPQARGGGPGLARYMFAAYGTVPVYAAFFRWLGWAEQLDPMVEAWQDGDRKRALELVPDDLIARDLHLRLPEEHARPPRAVRRRRHHDVRPDADHGAGRHAADDRRAGAAALDRFDHRAGRLDGFLRRQAAAPHEVLPRREREREADRRRDPLLPLPAQAAPGEQDLADRRLVGRTALGDHGL